MMESIEERKLRERQEDLARLRGLRPIDDDFMRCIFRDNIPLAQLVLRIIIGREDLIITRYYKEDPKGVEIMCRAFEEVREQGRVQGIEQGREQAQLVAIKKLMKNLELTAQQAMEVLEIPNTDREKLLVNLS